MPREVKAIDDFIESRRKAGQMRESKSPHSAPTFCVKKPQGGWRIVHATPSGMLWEWPVMPQGLKNAPATFNRCVTHLLRSVRDFAPSYFDD
ncbi:reverse transcriptase, partial [Phytophthora megakarya]